MIRQKRGSAEKEHAMPKKSSTASQKARAAARKGTKYTTAFRQHSTGRPSTSGYPDSGTTAWDVAAMMPKLDLAAMTPKLDLAAMMPKLDLAAMMPKLDLAAMTPKLDLAAMTPKLDLAAMTPKLDWPP